MSEQRYTPGYVNVPGKGQRYRNERGEYFDNHFGSIFNSFGNAVRGVGDAYNNYYDGVADAAGTERRDGTVKNPQKTPPTPQAPQSSVGSGNVINMGGKSYNMSDPKQKAAYEKAQKAELDRQRGRSPVADIRGGDGQKTDGSGRHSVRTSPTGVEQSGTQMGPRPMTMDDANRLLTGGYTVSNPFASNTLPTSATSLYGGGGYQAPQTEDIPQNMYAVRPKTMGQNLDMDAGPFDTGAVPENYMSGVEFQSEMLRGSPNIVQGGAAETAVVTNSATSKPEVEPAKGFNPDIARRRAFLDGDVGSMQALRRVEAQKGVVYAGGQHHMVNPNRGQEGQNDFVAISKADRDSYMRGNQSANDLKTKYVDAITNANASQDASTMTPTDTLSQTDITFESPAVTNPMVTALEDVPGYEQAPKDYSIGQVDIKTKNKKLGF